MRISSTTLITGILALCLIALLSGAIFMGCQQRACRDNLVCLGFDCVDNLCLTKCDPAQNGADGKNASCAQLRGFTCVENACVCPKPTGTTPSVLKTCHLECFRTEDCPAVISKLKELGVSMPAGDYSCEGAEGNKAGQCKCSGCGSGGEEGGTDTGGGFDAGDGLDLGGPIDLGGTDSGGSETGGTDSGATEKTWSESGGGG